MNEAELDDLLSTPRDEDRRRARRVSGRHRHPRRRRQDGTDPGAHGAHAPARDAAAA